MTTLEYIVLAALVLFPVALLAAVGGRIPAGLASGAAAVFAGFTLWPLIASGPLGLWSAVTAGAWGPQVLIDLGLALSVAVFLAAPRARAAGLRIAPWVVFTACTGSIGLLAFLARIIWRERQHAGRPFPTPS
ncbi:hypothetical protein MWU52_00755 [Jannaschia sp. S6380]|uniref:hypothetical protein n=1 Tax=Jannaschia sp. S6380 TaxID=2926408 RepID=UPI001FF621DC|nr:hypothetical protein [Jannaschia sp. S6380]MCK0166072.1 hypothetical protein [Jannaschia sp. S6380]